MTIVESCGLELDQLMTAPLAAIDRMIHAATTGCAGRPFDSAVSRMQEYFAAAGPSLLARLSFLPFPPGESNSHASPAEQARLVKMVVLVQDDSPGDEYFIPFSQDGRNIGICRTPDAMDISSLLGLEHGKDKLAARRVVLGSLPRGLSNWAAKRIGVSPEADEAVAMLIYGKQPASMKIGSIHEIVGILELPDKIEGPQTVEEEAEELYSHGRMSAGRHSSLVLHVLYARPANSSVFVGAPAATDLLQTRELAMSYLTATCDGDELLGELLLLHLVSRPALRVAGYFDSLMVGRLAVNIITSKDLAAGFGDRLHALLQSLRPTTAKIELALSRLNAAPLYPRMDHDAGQLVPNVLQLADGSHVLVDETHMETGALADQGVRNVQALTELIQHQSVSYDFGGQSVSLNVDLPVLVVSDGKSLLPVDCTVKAIKNLVPHLPFVEEAQMDSIRQYLQAARMGEFQIDPQMAAYLEQDYIRLRAEPTDDAAACRMDENEFHRLLGIARLNGISRGESTLALATWEATLLLDQHRRERASK